ncbi:MAG: Uncharacterized protein CEN91_70 [Candidatus Berkelbacteria bacterium Licking1014_85]|uniref:Uncharacterized protein n=1 Tax=Candidatus Berkelbacteria bacterium Licking1014_85 TaxID=2017148 RepID=A0A554LLZ7_9BACT|nr:MAG: Uncharacterized protein CEN91_70 [Candidatus Berkelbacteria bacterium Licking1014_85]
MALERKTPLVNDEYYHILNRSISGFKILNTNFDYLRFIDLLKYYQYQKPEMSYCFYDRLTQTQKNGLFSSYNESGPQKLGW